MTEVPPPPVETCEGCKYFRLDPEVVEAPIGLCRRYPPTSVFDNQGKIIWTFSRTMSHLWCGEWSL